MVVRLSPAASVLGVGVLFVPLAAHGYGTQYSFEIVFSEPLQNPQAVAKASGVGSITTEGLYIDGNGDVQTYVSETVPIFHSDIVTGASAATSTLTYAAQNNSFLHTGHFGSVSKYQELFSSISSEASASGNTLRIESGAFLTSEDRVSMPGLVGDATSKFVSGGGSADVDFTVGTGASIVSVTSDVDVRYVMGFADLAYPAGAYIDTWRIADPVSIVSLDVGGHTLTGSVTINDAGDVITAGEISYDSATEHFSFDTSSLVGQTFTGNVVTTMEVQGRLPGDFNGDSVVDVLDINDLFAQISASYTPTSVFDEYDLNLDGVVDHGHESLDTDTKFLIESLMLSKFGDANLDGTVDQFDLNIVQGNWGQTGLGWAGGDMNGNGVVEMADQGYVLRNWGWSRNSTNPLTSLPEPAVAALVGLGAVTMLRRRD